MMCHTNVSKYLRRVSLVQHTRRQARCLIQLLRYFLLVPPNGQVWHKGFFFGGSGLRAGDHMHQAWPKIPLAPLAFPLLGGGHSVNTAAVVFVARTHLTGKCGTRPFFGGSECKAVAHMRPAFPKIPTVLLAFPLLGVPQAPSD